MSPANFSQGTSFFQRAKNSQANEMIFHHENEVRRFCRAQLPHDVTREKAQYAVTPLNSPKRPKTKLKCKVPSPQSEDHEVRDMFDDLGADLALQFGPVRKPINIKTALKTQEQVEAYVNLKLQCESCRLDERFEACDLARVLVYCSFDTSEALKLLKQMDWRYWNVSMHQLEEQMITHTLFPLPSAKGLKSKDGSISSFVYFKASRFSPEHTPTSTIIANLLYVMDSLDTGSPSRRLGLIVNMKDWTPGANYSTEYWRIFLKALQGNKGPCKVDMILFVDSPVCFSRVWQSTLNLVTHHLKHSIHNIPHKDLCKHLAPGFEESLPDEIEIGQLQVPFLVAGYIKVRKYVEDEMYPTMRKPCRDTKDLGSTQKQSKTLFRRPSTSSIISLASSIHNTSKRMRNGKLEFSEHSQQHSVYSKLSSDSNPVKRRASMSSAFSSTHHSHDSKYDTDNDQPSYLLGTTITMKGQEKPVPRGGRRARLVKANSFSFSCRSPVGHTSEVESYSIEENQRLGSHPSDTEDCTSATCSSLATSQSPTLTRRPSSCWSKLGTSGRNVLEKIRNLPLPPSPIKSPTRRILSLNLSLRGHCRTSPLSSQDFFTSAGASDDDSGSESTFDVGIDEDDGRII